MDIDVSHAAFLCLHWQRDIIHPEGAFGAFFAQMVIKKQLLPRMSDLLHQVRSASIPVIYTRACYRPGHPELIQNNGFFSLIAQTGALVDGEPGAEIVPQLAPQPGDLVVNHRRITGFYGTDLNTILRAKGVTTLLMAGVATNATVEGTAREAVNEGYTVLVLEDCCTAGSEEAHQASIATLQLIAGVTRSDDVLRAIRHHGT